MSWWEPGHIESDAEPSPATNFILEDALATLTGKQRFVIELRFGLKDGEFYTLGEIAEVMGTTRPAVHHLEQKALRNLGR